MLPRFFSEIDRKSDAFIKKFTGAEDASGKGAFSFGTVIRFELSVSRRLGASGAVMRICRDGDRDSDISFSFESSDNIFDKYTISLDTAALCAPDGYGLFYYEILLLRGYNTLFTSSINNLDFELAEKEGARFRLLVYEKDFTTPKSFGKGVMYHIFVDRFYKGEGEQVKNLPVRRDAVINNDWEHGIPQFAEKPGDNIANNEFFGGNLWGIVEKLGYLKGLGVTYIYLSPIFEAYSNHKYDTGDYMKTDEMFGGDEALEYLISQAKKEGIGVILDGVFNHTGDDSLYFNKYKRYGDGGAYNDSESKYRDWYIFRNWPDEYECWWGIKILPKLNHSNRECRNFFVGKKGVIEKYTEMGIAGWRLDVADELSDEFLDEIRDKVKSESGGEAVIIGEVWENACDKLAYGKRRRYFSGRQLDSVMNYPVRNAILDFCRFQDGISLYNTLTEIYSSYPEIVSNKLMNILGTHDTERIFTVLGSDFEELEGSNAQLSVRRLSPEKREKAKKLLKIASVLQYTVFGIPSLYYGDEVGLEGYHDPFCRMPFPWNDMENEYRQELSEHYKKLGELRNTQSALVDGTFKFLGHSENYVVFMRKNDDNEIIVAANRGEDFTIDIPKNTVFYDLLNDKEYTGNVTVKSDSALILKVIV